MNEIETKIRDAIHTAIGRGLRVRPGEWGIAMYDGRWVLVSSNICPMAAVVLVEQPAITEIAAAAALALGVDPQWVMDFVWAFDGEVANGHLPSCHDAVDLARRLRSECANVQQPRAWLAALGPVASVVGVMP